MAFRWIFLDKLKANCISFQCLNETFAIEISEECDIPCNFIEILKMDDSAWESSLVINLAADGSV